MKTLEQQTTMTPTERRLARYHRYNHSEKGRARRETEAAQMAKRWYWRSPQGLAMARERHARYRAGRTAFLAGLLAGWIRE